MIETKEAYETGMPCKQFPSKTSGNSQITENVWRTSETQENGNLLTVNYPPSLSSKHVGFPAHSVIKRGKDCLEREEFHALTADGLLFVRMHTHLEIHKVENLDLEL